jgi:PTS system fructose-specific IIC component
MNGVSHMLPFVVGGGILIALSFLFDMGNAGGPIFGNGNEFSKMLNVIGVTGFTLMVPIMAGFIAHSIADRPGFVPGFVGGILCNGINGKPGSGFLGGILAGFIAGYFMKLLIRSLRNFPESLEGLKAIFIYPIVGMFVVGAIVY